MTKRRTGKKSRRARNTPSGPPVLPSTPPPAPSPSQSPASPTSGAQLPSFNDLASAAKRRELPWRKRLAALIAVSPAMIQARAHGQQPSIRWPADARVQLEQWLLEPGTHKGAIFQKVVLLSAIGVIAYDFVFHTWETLQMRVKVGCVLYLVLCLAEVISSIGTSPLEILLAGLGAFYVAKLTPLLRRPNSLLIGGHAF